jgi:hypothetical protein
VETEDFRKIKDDLRDPLRKQARHKEKGSYINFRCSCQHDINPMGIVCDSKKLIFLIKPTPTPSKEGNLILQTSKFIIYKTRRVNNQQKRKSAVYWYYVELAIANL